MNNPSTGLGPEITETELRRAGENALVAYFKDRLMRAGALHDVERADIFLFDRVDRATRRLVIDTLFPTLYADAAAA